MSIEPVSLLLAPFLLLLLLRRRLAPPSVAPLSFSAIESHFWSSFLMIFFLPLSILSATYLAFSPFFLGSNDDDGKHGGGGGGGGGEEEEEWRHVPAINGKEKKEKRGKME